MTNPTDTKMTPDQLSEIISACLTNTLLRVRSFADSSGLSHHMQDVRKADAAVFWNKTHELPSLAVGYLPEIETDLFLVDLEGLRGLVVDNENPELLLMFLAHPDTHIVHMQSVGAKLAYAASLGVTQATVDAFVAGLSDPEKRPEFLLGGYQLARYLETQYTEAPIVKEKQFFSRLLTGQTNDLEVEEFVLRTVDLLNGHKASLPEAVDVKLLDAVLEEVQDWLETTYAEPVREDQ